MGEMPARQSLLREASNVKNIPAFNGVVEKVLVLLENRNASIRQLADAIEYDQAITSKIVSIANSAYYSRGIHIYDLHRAMITIGLSEVRSIILCILFIDNMLKKFRISEREMVHLWEHSALVAYASRMLSERMMAEDPEKVFTIGLLHDIGKPILYLCHENYLHLEREAKARGKDVVAIERERFETDHEELGEIMARKWKLPDEFVEVIGNHHGCEPADRSHEAARRIVVTADCFYSSRNGCAGRELDILQREQSAVREEVDKVMGFLLHAGKDRE